jgi:bacteriocin biosynthesis cyclodehydratase domain-containing protein
VLLLLLQLRAEEHELIHAMLLPGVRLVDRPGALHFFDGRRVVSFRGDSAGRNAIRQAVDPDAEPAGTGGRSGSAELRDARDLLVRLELGSAEPQPHVPVAAAFASAAVAGRTSGQQADERLSATAIHVWDGPDGSLRHTLEASGFATQALNNPAQVGDLDPRRALVAVVASDERPVHRLRAANEACLAAGVAWLPVGAYDGAVLRVGPLMIPGQTACADCLLRRLAANVAYAEVHDDVVEAPAAPTPPALRSWAHSVATLLLVQWIANRDAQIPGRLFSLVPDGMTIRQAHVLRVPRCHTCTSTDFTPAAAPWGVSRDH